MEAIISDLCKRVQCGEVEKVQALVKTAIDQGMAPLDILENGLRMAMMEVGKKFEVLEIFLPEVILAADAMTAGVDILQPYLKVAGDGSAVRDFIYLDDVVEGMLLALEKAPPCFPINLGSGVGCSIKTLVETMAELVSKKPRIEWDLTKPTGDSVRILATQRAKEILGFEAKTPLREGLKKTIEWYLANTEIANRRGKELLG